MTPVPLEKLQSAIIKPGIEKHLEPLTKYRGSLSLGRAHRLVNMLIAGMEQDCSLADVTQRLQRNPDFSHLCGPENLVQSSGLYGFFSRLEDNPSATNNVPHLLEYVRHLGGHRFRLVKIGEARLRRRNSSKKREPRAPDLVYPFLIHDGGRPEHDLLRRVSAAVPKWVPDDRRADICQDLIVGVLCGDISEDDLLLPAKVMTTKVLAQYPMKYGDVSLDDIIPGTDNLRIIDTLSEEDSIWNYV